MKLHRKVLHCFCDGGAVGYRAVCYLRPVCGSEIHSSFLLEKPRVPHRLVLCAATVAIKLARLVARLVKKGLELKVAWEVTVKFVNKIVHFLNFSLLQQRQIWLQPSCNL